MYATHPVMVIDPCAKYGKPMSKQKKLQAGHKDMSKKKLWARHESAQIDRQTDRQ